MLFMLQVALGIFKVCWAFSDYGSKRRMWHLSSGLAIMAMGLVLVAQG
jgi:hypothetical protein